MAHCNKLVLFFQILLISLISSSCSEGWYLTYEKPEEPPYRNFELEDLFLDTASFPKNLELKEITGPFEACESSPLGSGCRSYEAQINFYTFALGRANIEIHRYTSEKKASADFSRLLNNEFTVNDFETEWIVPKELPFHSDFTDRSFFACHKSRSSTECRYHAQYVEFNLMLYFVSSLDMDQLNYDDLESLLSITDNRMHQFLDE